MRAAACRPAHTACRHWRNWGCRDIAVYWHQDAVARTLFADRWDQTRNGIDSLDPRSAWAGLPPGRGLRNWFRRYCRSACGTVITVLTAHGVTLGLIAGLTGIRRGRPGERTCHKRTPMASTMTERPRS